MIDKRAPLLNSATISSPDLRTLLSQSHTTTEMSSPIPHSVDDYVKKALNDDSDTIQDVFHYTKLALFDENSSKSGITLMSESSTEGEEDSDTDTVDLANIAFACVIHSSQSALGE